LLRQQGGDADVGAAPAPDLAALGVLRVAPVAEVAIHPRPPLAQRHRETAVEVVVWCHAVREGMGTREQDVAGYLADHRASNDSEAVTFSPTPPWVPDPA